jgi:dipeptidyl aminopeptidase/acylaminoacyl peptidase
VPVKEVGNALPSYLDIKDAYLNLRMGREGQTFQYGIAEGHRGELRLSPQDLRQGGGLVSVAADGRAYVLATVAADTLGLLELDLRAGTRRTLVQEAVDVRRVVLNPLDMTPDAVEIEQGESEWKVLNERVSKDVAYLHNAGWGAFRIIDRSPNDRYWIVKYGTRPGVPVWTVYDRSSGALRQVGLSGAVDSVGADWQVHNFTVARVGEPELRGYLTLPRLDRCAHGLCPLVLKLHGGPSLRDYGDVDPERLWLLNRGIAVATINYRGSRGYGKLFESLDKRQWTSGIPRDVLDGLEHVLKNFPLNRMRVAVMGTSFSAYLALKLAYDHPQFKCALIDSATTDLAAFVEDGVRNHGERSDLIERVGDVRLPQTRADLLAISPVSHIEQLKKLTLLQLQGGRDKTTPATLNQAFVENMLATNPDFTYVLMEGEGHGLTGARADYYAMAEQFLGKCLDVSVEKLDVAARTRLLDLNIRGNKAVFE